jgi:hypothetical protein
MRVNASSSSKSAVTTEVAAGWSEKARTGSGARFRRISLLLFLLSVSACGALFRHHDVTPAGLARSDATWRQLLAKGQADTALQRFQVAGKAAPTDDLLRTLYQGVVAYHAGQYDSSALWLDRANLLLDDRDVFWVSREAASLLSNDRALPYRPSRTERLLLPYYGALSWLRAGNTTEAAVEARRLSQALAQLGGVDGESGTADRERQLYGLLRLFAATVFETAGERNDAGVAYRHAALLLADTSLHQAVASRDSSDIVIVMEEGFVAHRIEQSITIVLAADESDGLRDRDEKRRESAANEVATRALSQVLKPALQYDAGPRAKRQHWFIPAPPRDKEKRRKDCARDSAATAASKAPAADSAVAVADKSKERDKCKDDDDDTYILRLAWPAYHAVRRPELAAQVVIGDSTRVPMQLFVNVSDAVVTDFDRERARILARMVVRAAAKLALVKSAENSVGKKHEELGNLLGAVANVSGALLEQADTRSWSLLPGGIGLIRLRVPAGNHKLGMELGTGSSSPVHLELGEVQAKPGQLQILTARHWQ